MLYRYQRGGGGGGGGVIARETVASRVQAPPAFCTEAKVAKGEAYLRDTTVHVHILVLSLSPHTQSEPPPTYDEASRDNGKVCYISSCIPFKLSTRKCYGGKPEQTDTGTLSH